MSAELFILNSFGQQKNKKAFEKNLSDISCDKFDLVFICISVRLCHVINYSHKFEYIFAIAVRYHNKTILTFIQMRVD